MSQEKTLVTDTLQEVKENIDLFYQQKTGQALEQFHAVLGKILTMVDVLSAYQKEHAEFSFDEEKVKDTLQEALSALEERDMIFLADIIQYDFVDYIQELVNEME